MTAIVDIWRVMIAAALLYGLALSAHAAPLTVAAFNIEHLAEKNGEGCRPRSEADYAALRAYVGKINADVIAFAEVQNAAAAVRVFLSDKWVIVIEERPDNGRVVECRGDPAHRLLRQAVGFAVRKNIQFTRNPDFSALGLSDPNLRTGVDITIDLPKKLRLLSIHLKSGCFAANDPNNDACDILDDQLPILEQWIDQRASEPTPFAVLGDWNHRLAHPNDWFWTEIDDGKPLNADLQLAQGAQKPKCDPQYNAFIDHIALDRRATETMIAGSFVEWRY